MTVETPRPEYEHITPQRAEQLLDRMPVNRRVKHQRVSTLVNAMLAGDFDPYNGESIKIDSNGNLVDGQHRLEAIVQSRIPFDLLVVRGVKPEALYTVDTGAARKLTDALAMEGEVNISYLSATIRGSISFARNEMGEYPGTPVTTVQALRFLEEHPSLRDSALAAGNYTSRSRTYGRILTPITYGPLHWLFSKYSPTDADFFFDRVSIGDEISQDHPAWVLRRTVTNLRNRSISMSHHGPYLQALTIKAWNGFIEGRPIGNLKFSPGGAKPEAFPTILGEDLIRAKIAQEAATSVDAIAVGI